MQKRNFIETRLDQRRATKRLRQLCALTRSKFGDCVRNEQKVLNFCSNDYLGLSLNPLLKQRAAEYLDNYGVGATASRLVCGHHDYHQELESKLAMAVGQEAALIFNNGYQANATLIPALMQRQHSIFIDRLCHNSLIHGALHSRARIKRFKHNSLAHLEELLRADTSSRRMIVVESLYSMDGDCADIPALIHLAQDYDALLYVDDAHAIGVMGKNGMGLTAGYPEIDISVATFGKACGSFGAFVACSALLRDYLVNECAGLIYTTALPPAVIGSIDAAIDLIPILDSERSSLSERACFLRQRLQRIGFDTGESSSQIIPIIVKTEEKALELAAYLEENGVLVTAIRPPTVPEGECRLRVTACLSQSQDDVSRLLSVLEDYTG